ncbi:MAG: class I SAM-dependent methyltransferase [Gemmatimonadota bacterium]
MRSEEERLVRRAAFDAIPEEYDAARPPYPPALLADLVKMSGLQPGRDVLELGAGTGQLTLPLAETGASVLAVELGPDLAALLRGKVRDRGNVTVVAADFDTWDADGRTFDHVMVASAFHWLDPATRLGRCHALLRRGGSIAIVDVRWGVRTERSDDLFSEIQACYERWDPTHDPAYWHPTPEQVPTRRDELRDSGLFEDVRHRRYERHHRYTKRRFTSLIGTYSTVRSWGAELREGFLGCVAALFDERFPAGVTQTDLYDLTVAWVAESRPDPARGRR